MKSVPLVATIPLLGSTNDVLTAGGFNAQFGRASNITMYANGDAAGLTMNMSWDDGSGGETILPNGSAVGVASTVGKIKTNEDFVIQFAVPAGVRLLLNVQNPTAGAINFNALLVLN